MLFRIAYIVVIVAYISSTKIEPSVFIFSTAITHACEALSYLNSRNESLTFVSVKLLRVPVNFEGLL